MDLNFFKDHLFDLLNESNLLDAQDIQYDDKTSTFQITVYDSTIFELTCDMSKQADLHKTSIQKGFSETGKVISIEKMKLNNRKGINLKK